MSSELTLVQISWSGCKDSQTSADAYEAGTATGAMSYVRTLRYTSRLLSLKRANIQAFITVLSQKPQQSYQELLVNIRCVDLPPAAALSDRCSQGHPEDEVQPEAAAVELTPDGT